MNIYHDINSRLIRLVPLCCTWAIWSMCTLFSNYSIASNLLFVDCFVRVYWSILMTIIIYSYIAILILCVWLHLNSSKMIYTSTTVIIILTVQWWWCLPYKCNTKLSHWFFYYNSHKIHTDSYYTVVWKYLVVKKISWVETHENLLHKKIFNVNNKQGAQWSYY